MKNTFRYSYQTRVSINCKKDKLWNVLTDLDNYHLWNPFTPKIETNWIIGERVILMVQMRKGKKPIRQIEYLTRYSPKTELACGMKWSIFLSAERVQQICCDTNGLTIYFTEDIISGPLSPLVHLLYGRYIQRGFNSLASSLKNYLEN